MGAIDKRFTSAATQVEDLSEAFVKCEPLMYPTATLVHALQGSPPTESVVRWGEVESKPVYITVDDSGGVDTTTTTIGVEAQTCVKAGDTLRNPYTGELIIVGASASTSLTSCTRGALGGAGCTSGTGIAIEDNAILEVVGQNLPEGFTYANVNIVAQNPAPKYNEFSRQGYAVSVSGTQLALEKRGDKAYGYGYEDDYDEALTNLKRDINMSLLNGYRSNNSGTYTSKYTMAGGIPYFAGWTDASVGDLSDAINFENKLKPIAEYSPGIFLCPSSWKTMQSIQRLYQGDNIGAFNGEILKATGIKVREVTHPMGSVFNFYYDPTLPDIYYNAGSVWQGQFRVFSPKYTKIHYNRPVGRYEVPPTTDAVTEIVMAEWTFSLKGSKRFGTYSGVTALT